MNLLKWFLGQTCKHRFAWPRNDEKGRHYQICLTCGSSYEYNWAEMRRTGRLIATEVQHGYLPQTGSSLVRSLVFAARGTSGREVSQAHS